MRYSEIEACRLCRNRNLVPVLDLGIHALSGVFPRTRDEHVTSGPLELVKCHGEDACGLLQLRQSYDPAEMYGAGYGYRSGLNPTMVEHLHAKVHKITSLVELKPGDAVVDIGSNDGTLLQAYSRNLELAGFDPSGEKFRQYYPEDIHLVSDFFSALAYRDEMGSKKAKVVTSIAMLYDLEDPLRFAHEVHEVLADNGVWVTEQSYAPAMLANGSYDTICHEHLEYYALRQIEWIAEKIGFRILGVEFNSINGGSFSVVLGKVDTPYPDTDIRSMLDQEPARLGPYIDFARNISWAKHDLNSFFAMAKVDGISVLGLGASTKGNTILQYCGITKEELPAIGDVNTDKWGCFTPGTSIPILPEYEVLALRPEYLLVLPWHFRTFFENDPKFAGKRLVFPLPSLSLVNA